MRISNKERWSSQRAMRTRKRGFQSMRKAYRDGATVGNGAAADCRTSNSNGNRAIELLSKTERALVTRSKQENKRERTCPPPQVG